MTLLDNWAAVAGFVTGVVTFYRMNLGMEQEFSSQEEIVIDPLAFAVRRTATWNEFQAESWKGFDALLQATRFWTFYHRWRLLLDPAYSILVWLLVLVVFVGSLLYVQLLAKSLNFEVKDLVKINNCIGGGFALIVIIWWAIVDRGKALKKSVEKLRIT